MGSGGSLGIRVLGRGYTVVSLAVVLDFGGGIAEIKAMAVCNPVVGVMVVVLDHGATVGGITLGLMVGVCYRVVLLELLILVRSL